MGWDCVAKKEHSVTHILLVMEWDVVRLHNNKWGQYHSHTVSHWMRCDDTAWQKKGFITHKLLGCDENPGQEKGAVSLTSCCHGRCDDSEMRLCSRKRVASLTTCRSWDVMGWDCMAGKKCDIIHILLLVMGLDCLAEKTRAVSLTSCWSWNDMCWYYMAKKRQCHHTHAVGHGMRYDETAWQKEQCHSHTVVMEWDMMILPCWKKCHSLAVGNRMRLHDRKKGGVTYIFLLVMGWNVMRLLGRKNMQQSHSLAVGHG